MVDTPDSKSDAAMHEGSSPSAPIRLIKESLYTKRPLKELRGLPGAYKGQ